MCLHWLCTSARMALSGCVAINKQALGHRSANCWLLLLSIDLPTFYDVSSTRGLHLSAFGGLTSSRVFYHCRSSSPTPTNHLYLSTCGIDGKVS